jgi:hypothetical protein
MTDNRFRNGHYEDALEFAKEVLSNSSSIEEIIKNSTIKEDEKEDENKY